MDSFSTIIGFWLPPGALVVWPYFPYIHYPLSISAPEGQRSIREPVFSIFAPDAHWHPGTRIFNYSPPPGVLRAIYPNRLSLPFSPVHGAIHGISGGKFGAFYRLTGSFG